MFDTTRMIRTPVITIDDCSQLAGEGLRLFQKLADYLNTMGKYKYPLEVRKGPVLRREVEKVTHTQNSVQIKTKTRTYFLDIKRTTDGRRYLRFTESRLQGKDGKPERNQIVIFPEDSQAVLKPLTEMVGRLA